MRELGLSWTDISGMVQSRVRLGLVLDGLCTVGELRALVSK